MPTVTSIPHRVPLVRAVEPIDGRLLCWRCENPCDGDGYCSLCGAVTAPTREPAPTTTRPPATAPDSQTFDALTVLLSTAGCEVFGLA